MSILINKKDNLQASHKLVNYDARQKKIVYPNRLNNEYDLYIQNPISKLLSSFQNLNLNNSSSFYSNDILHFNLEFKSSEQLNATASGIYNSKSSSLKINIKYLFENEITKNGYNLSPILA